MISRNIVSNYVGNLLPILVGFFLTPFLVSHLGETAFGLWILMQTIKSSFRLLEFGLKDALVKYIAEKAGQQGQKQEQRAKKQEPGSKSQEGMIIIAEKDGEVCLNRKAYLSGLVSTSFFIFLLLGVLSLAIIVVVAFFFSHIFRIPSALENLAFTVTSLLGLQVLISFPSRILYSVFKGFQRFDLLNAIFVGGEILNAIVTVLLLSKGFGLQSLVLLGVILSSLELAMQWLLVTRIYPIEISLKHVHKAFWQKAARYSVWSSLLDLSNQLGMHIDEIVIGVLIGVSAITPYAIGRKLANFVFRLIEPVTDIFFPLSSQLKARNDYTGLRHILLSGTRTSLFIATPLSLGLFYYGEEVIKLWIGANYPGSKDILRIFLGVIVISAFLGTADNMLRGSGNLRFITIIAFFEGLCNLTLSILLIKNYGLIGVGLGTLIPMGISNILVVFPYACEVFGLSWREVLRFSVFPVVLPLFFELMVLFALELVTHEVNFLTILWKMALSLSVYIFFYYLFTNKMRLYENFRGHSYSG